LKTRTTKTFDRKKGISSTTVEDDFYGKIGMREIELPHYTINESIRSDDYTFWWPNDMTVRQMEKALRKTKKIPSYYGFANFSDDYNAVTFKPWPFYYKDSKRIRRRQRRQKLGRWLYKIAIKLKE